MIRRVNIKDAEALASIYNYYIEHTIITFEDVVLSAQAFEKRILDISTRYPWLVWEEDSKILGYAYANTWKVRSAYRYSVEATVYLSHKKGAQKRGIGTLLYRRLLEELKAKQIHCVIGGVALPNEASMAMHKKLGFQYVGTFKAVGYKLDQWLDVAYWQINLE